MKSAVLSVVVLLIELSVFAAEPVSVEIQREELKGTPFEGLPSPREIQQAFETLSALAWGRPPVSTNKTPVEPKPEEKAFVDYYKARRLELEIGRRQERAALLDKIATAPDEETRQALRALFDQSEKDWRERINRLKMERLSAYAPRINNPAVVAAEAPRQPVPAAIPHK